MMRQGTSPLIPPRGILLDRQLNHSRDSPVSTPTRLRTKPFSINFGCSMIFFSPPKHPDGPWDPLGFLGSRKDGARPAIFLIFVLFYVFFVLFYVFFVLFYVFLCCSTYCLFCVVICIVCVYMCTVLLPPCGYPIAVKYIISYIQWVSGSFPGVIRLD